MKSSYIQMLIIKICAAGLLFISQVIPARVMNIDQFGMYSYLVSIITVVSFLVIWGTDKSIIKFFSMRHQKSKKEISEKMFGVWMMVLINTVVIGYMMVFYLNNSLNAVYFSNIELLAVVSLLVIALARISSSITKGISKVIASEIVFNIVRPMLFILGVLFVYLMSSSVTLLEAVMVFIASYFLSFLVTAYISHKSVDLTISFSPGSIFSVYKYSFAFLFVSIGSPLIANIDLLQLGSMVQASEIALYSVASKIVNLVLLGLVSANLLIAPKISPLYYSKRLGELRMIIRNNNIFVLGLTIIPVAIIIFFADYILLLFGEQYIEANQITMLLLIGQMVSVFCGPVLLVAVMAGLQKEAAVIVMSACGIIWVLCEILIPIYGMFGAAYANICGYSLMNITAAYYVHKHTGLNVTMTNIIVKDNNV